MYLRYKNLLKTCIEYSMGYLLRTRVGCSFLKNKLWLDYNNASQTVVKSSPHFSCFNALSGHALCLHISYNYSSSLVLFIRLQYKRLEQVKRSLLDNRFTTAYANNAQMHCITVVTTESLKYLTNNNATLAKTVCDRTTCSTTSRITIFQNKMSSFLKLLDKNR